MLIFQNKEEFEERERSGEKENVREWQWSPPVSDFIRAISDGSNSEEKVLPPI
jgi:hypothetical protein